MHSIQLLWNYKIFIYWGQDTVTETDSSKLWGNFLTLVQLMLKWLTDYVIIMQIVNNNCDNCRSALYLHNNSNQTNPWHLGTRCRRRYYARKDVKPIEMKFWKALRNTEIFFNVLFILDVWKDQPDFKHLQIDIIITQSWYKPLSSVKHEISLIHKYKMAKVFVSESDWQDQIMQEWLW